MSSSDWDLMFTDVYLNLTWPPDHHLTFPWLLPDPYITLIRRFKTSPELPLAFFWYSLGIPRHSPDHHLTFPWPSKKSFLVVWWWWVGQPITDPMSGSLLTFCQLNQELTRTWERTLPEIDNMSSSKSIQTNIWSWKIAVRSIVRSHPRPNLSPRHPSFVVKIIIIY